MKRPLMAVALLLTAGILAGSFPISVAPLFCAAGGLTLLLLFWPRASPLLAGLLVFLVGVLSVERETAILSPNDLRLLPQGEALALVRGVLRDSPKYHLHHKKNRDEWSSTSVLAVEAIAYDRGTWRPAFGKLVANTPGRLEVFAGQKVEISGVIGAAPGPVAEGLFDYRFYLSQQGIYHHLKVQSSNDWRVVESPAKPPLADQFGAWARKAIALGLPAEDESLRLEWALTLGWKEGLTEEASDSFVKASTYHIFAVDGLRVAIISGILLMLLRVLAVPRMWCGLACIPALWFYAALTEWPASAIRAIIMLVVVIIGWVLKRPSDMINSLLAAAVVILVWEPRQLCQAGFQLSFFVVLCIILILPPLNQLGERFLRPDPFLPEALQPRWRRMLRPPLAMAGGWFLTSLAAWLGSIPLVAYYFHLVTPLSGAANVIAVPLCGLVLICNLTSLLFAAWLPPVAVLFNHAGWFCMEMIRRSSGRFAGLPGAYFYLGTPGIAGIVLYYAVLLSVMTGWLWRNPFRNWKIVVLMSASVVWLAMDIRTARETWVTILPLEGGHAVFAEEPGLAECWLIDCGNEPSVESVVKPFLEARGVNRLSNFVLTHGEEGYSGGAAEVEKLFRPRRVYWPPVKFASPSMREFQQLLANDPAKQTPPASGDKIGPWSVLYPDQRKRLPRGEDNAMVLSGCFSGLKILLLSDLGHAGQGALLALGGDLQADIVVAAPPGTGEPLSDALLEAVRPRVIVIADSTTPATRRAGRDLQARLAQGRVPVLYTHVTEAVKLVVEPGGRWRLQGMDGTMVNGEVGLTAIRPLPSKP